MSKVILLRFGELYLKGKNRGFFEKTLISNIKESLQDYSCNVIKSSGRYFVTNYDEMDEEQIVTALTKVFGLVSLSVTTEIETSKQNIDYRKRSKWDKENLSIYKNDIFCQVAV